MADACATFDSIGYTNWPDATVTLYGRWLVWGPEISLI
jgi:hypothetical protein